MAGKKKAKKAGRLPKDVLGVKLPKDLRKAGDRLIERATSPAGQQAIVGALTMVAAAASAAAAKGRDRDAAASHDAGAAAGGGAAAGAEQHGASRTPDPQALAGQVEQFVEKAFGRLFGGARG